MDNVPSAKRLKRMIGRRRRFHRAVATAIGCTSLVLVAALSVATALQSRVGRVVLNTASGVVPAKAHRGGASGSRLAERLVGTWEDFYHGKRTLTLRPDGTATMLIQFTGLKARLFTPRLQLDLVWSIENGRMRRRIVGGTPPSKVAVVIQHVGDVAVESIERLTEDRMQLKDVRSGQVYDWHRVR